MIRWVPSFALGGFCFGALTALINGVSHWQVLLVIVTQIIGVGWSWAGVGVLAGALAPRQRGTTATVTLLLAVIGYYLVDLWRGVYTFLDPNDPNYLTDPRQAGSIILWDALVSDVIFWGVAAILLGFALGRVGGATRRSDLRGLASRLVVPVGAAVEMLAVRLPAHLLVQPDPVVVSTMTASGLLGVLIAGALVVAHARTRTRRVLGRTS
ncbi:hypothetical protein [Salinibacterium sp. ZJ454]|uniref:hypothetical protein n=1 Tax=Salinibacterium sp. ZJ454 TaxID=2708339 RepID=UPI0014249D31|nr:hypothetical protein [Salinibacterium sp. ZJ454]